MAEYRLASALPPNGRADNDDGFIGAGWGGGSLKALPPGRRTGRRLTASSSLHFSAWWYPRRA